jgi:hypothetical protein
MCWCSEQDWIDRGSGAVIIPLDEENWLSESSG